MKKEYSFFSNIKYIFKTIWPENKYIIFVQLALIPLNVVIPTIEIYIPKILVDDIATKVGTEKIVFDIFILTCFIMVLKILLSKLSCFSAIYSEKISKQFDMLFSKKIMAMDFELLESAMGRREYKKAKNSLSEYGVYGFLNSLFNFLTNFFGFITYVRIITELNWIIVPIIIFLEIIGAGVAFGVRKLDHKMKSERADAERKLQYINNVSRDYIAAKDIRIYTLSGYLMQLGRTFIEQRKYWTSKQYGCFLINNFSTALISMVMTGGTYGYLIHLLINSNLNVGDVVLYLGVILGFTSWVNGVAENVDVLGRANQATKDMREFLDMNISKRKSTNLKREQIDFVSEKNKDIILNNVSYKYPNNVEKIISNLN